MATEEEKIFIQRIKTLGIDEIRAELAEERVKCSVLNENFERQSRRMYLLMVMLSAKEKCVAPGTMMHLISVSEKTAELNFEI